MSAIFNQHIRNHGQNVTPNTFIGGIGGSINSPKLLANKIGISINRISGFKISGSDVSCRIKGSYTITPFAFAADSSLTYYDDMDGLVFDIGNRTLRAATNLIRITMPSANIIGDECIFNSKIETINLPLLTTFNGTYGSFRANTLLKTLNCPNVTTSNWVYSGIDGCSSLELVNVPKLKRFRNPVQPIPGQWVFSGSKIGFTLNIHIDALTIDGGLIDPDVDFAHTNRGAIVNFYDDNGDYVSTL